MKWLLVVSGALALALGVALLLASQAVMAPMGLVLDARLATLGQAQGAVLVALGVINLLARNLRAEAVVPVLAGNLVAQVLGFAVRARAIALHLVAETGWGAQVMHLLLGALFAYFLVRTLRGAPARAS